MKRMLELVCLLVVLLFSGNLFSAEVKTPLFMRGVGQFYRTSPGTVAFVPYADTREEAKKAVEFRVLEYSGAYKLKRQSAYWFVVNHRTSYASEITYLGVEVIPIYPEGIEPQTPVFLRRNSGWVRPGDPAFDGQASVKKAFESKEIIEFINFHKINSKLSEMDEAFGFKWHATPEQSSKNSWNNRLRWRPSGPVDSNAFRNSFSPEISPTSRMMLNGILIRFQTTNRVVSHKPLLFGFSGKDPVAAYLKIFSPDAPDFDREYYLTFE